MGRVDDPYGGDFLNRIAGTPSNVQRARLRRITDALKVAVPQLQDLELTRDQKGTPHLEGRYEHWRPQGARQDRGKILWMAPFDSLACCGQFWMAAVLFCWRNLNSPYTVRLSVTSHNWFARVQRKTRRQMMLSTHSPELLQDPGVGLDEASPPDSERGGDNCQLLHPSFRDIPALLQGGLSLSEAISPRTRPQNPDQLGLFEAIG